MELVYKDSNGESWHSRGEPAMSRSSSSSSNSKSGRSRAGAGAGAANTALYWSVLHCTAVYRILPHRTAPYCIVLHRTAHDVRHGTDVVSSVVGS